MEYLTTADPTAIAREHEPIVDALDRGDGRQVGALLRSHSKGLVQYLRTQRTAELGAAAAQSAEAAGDDRRRHGLASRLKLRRA